MNATDFRAVTHDGAAYCYSTDCLPDEVDPDGEEVHPIFADSEWDYYPTCDSCGEVHNYVNLTDHGRRQRWLHALNPYMRRMAEDNGGSLPSFAWPGGYPLYYLDKHAAVICPACANKLDAEGDDLPFCAGTHWEGEPLPCECCDAEVESACGPVPEPADIDLGELAEESNHGTA